jgi:pimeloyl-ACP methyl ester carboxylesterase
MASSALNYRTEGNGMPLLMIHGFGISFNIWESLIPLLRPHFTLIMVELPGIGYSLEPGPSYLDEAVSGLERVRSLLGIGRWDVFSYSSGTRTAEKYIQLNPVHVERAVFLCPAQTSRIKAFGLYIAIRLDQYIPQLSDWILSGPRLRFLINLLGFNLKKNPLSSQWFAEISSQPLGILKETLRSLANSCEQPFCIPNGIPALFVWGDEDLLINVPSTVSRQDRIIHSTHSAPQTAALKVSELVLPFLLSTDRKS